MAQCVLYDGITRRPTMEPIKRTLKDQKTVLENDDKFNNLSDEEKHDIEKRFDEYIKKELKGFAENYIAERYKKDE